MKKRRQKDSELTAETLETLLTALDSDPERAAQKYEQLRRSLMFFFRRNGLGLSDQLEDETIDRGARRIREGIDIQPEKLFAYFRGVAVRVLQEYQRASKPQFAPPPA